MAEQPDYDRYVPEHVRDNYRQLVEERHGGDWSRLARELDANGDTPLAKWAASQSGAKSDDKPENAMDKTETTKRAPGRPRKDN